MSGLKKHNQLEEFKEKVEIGQKDVTFLGDYSLKDKPMRDNITLSITNLPLNADRKPIGILICKIKTKNNRVRVFAIYQPVEEKK